MGNQKSRKRNAPSWRIPQSHRSRKWMMSMWRQAPTGKRPPMSHLCVLPLFLLIFVQSIHGNILLYSLVLCYHHNGICSSSSEVLSLLHGRRSPDSPAEQQTNTDETHHALSTETEPTAMESWRTLKKMEYNCLPQLKGKLTSLVPDTWRSADHFDVRHCIFQFL